MDIKLQERILRASFEYDLKKHLANLEVNSQYEIVRKALTMDSQACYGIFGVSNDKLEDQMTLVSNLINGLYDDADLTVQDFDGLKHIAPGGTSKAALSVDAVLGAIRFANDESNFYAEFHNEIEGGNREYIKEYMIRGRRLREFMNELESL